MAKKPTQLKGSTQEQTETPPIQVDQTPVETSKAKEKPDQFPDPNSPNALKKQAAERAKNQPKRETFVVMKPQLIDGEWVTPAVKGEDPKTVELLEVQARFRLLNGKLARPTELEA